MSEVAAVRTDDRWVWAIVVAQLLAGTVTIFAGAALTWVSTIATVAALYLAYRDWRQLARSARYERFHWLWGVFPPVYVIGRGAFRYRATGSGLVITVLYAVLLAVGYLGAVLLQSGLLR
ncbi:hypothetical protein HQQ80_20325 [Microbacteriaceae bacterium VKM Ac-2855]|nr:hypothetical protein [Microbacteriaceae bacterium VKM Ac-2855]